MPETTLYWHDYETFGIDPARDGPAQFAGVRTNEMLEEIEEPLVLYCRPVADRVPSPEACLVTGITPQLALEKGVLEADFVRRIHQQLSRPGTCGVGFNSLRFDDEVTRHALFRNFHDPYGREWQNGCSRWDIIDLARMTAALRPAGIEWPLNEAGNSSFRLEHLTAANGIAHEGAHDALSDVRATIGLARLLRERQPRLYHWLFELRAKRKVMALIDIPAGKPLLHTTRMYPAATHCTSLVLPLTYETGNRNSVLVYDLRVDPGPFVDLPVEALHRRLFTPIEQLGDPSLRLPVKSMKVNKCPALAPVSVMDDAAAKRTGINTAACARHREQLMATPEFAVRVEKAFSQRTFESGGDVDASLYNGFLNDHDRALAQRVSSATANELATEHYDFHDARLEELLFRYRARNWPESLNDAEREQWEMHCQSRYQDEERGLERYFDRINQLREAGNGDARSAEVLDRLERWGDELLAGTG